MLHMSYAVRPHTALGCTRTYLYTSASVHFDRVDTQKKKNRPCNAGMARAERTGGAGLPF